MSCFKTIFVFTAIIILHVVSVRAELQVIGTATAGYDEDGIVGDDYYNLIYDTEQQIVFLDYVRASDQWINQMNWVAGLSLNVLLNPGFSTTVELSTGWRLPTVETPEETSIPSPPAPGPSFLFDRLGARSDHCAYDGYRSDMACLYYSALGNAPSPADCETENTYDPFINLPGDVTGGSFWTDSEVGTPGGTNKWDFDLCDGELFAGETDPGSPEYDELPAIAVHEAIVQQISLSGDINDDGFVDLKDTILGLQVIVGETPADISTNGDVNNDSVIGLQEVIYILDEAAN